MKNYLVLISMILGYSAFSQSNNYENAWKSLNKNNRPEAEKFLEQAMKDPSSYADAYITELYVKTYNRKEDEVKNFISSFYKKTTDPYPYIYALWSNKALVGAIGKKTTSEQVDLMNNLVSDKNAPGTLVAAANYNEKIHYLFSGEFQKAASYSDAVGNIKEWQFTGPFENLSQSGFYKDYGPLEHPEPNAIFKSISGADIKWFTPQNESKDGWKPIIYQFNKNTAIVYAQSFVTSPQDQTVYCNIGCAGSVKVWINDELVISGFKEKSTELDHYSIRYDLKKGANRVLVQIGYSNSSYPSFSLRITDDQYRPITNLTTSTTFVSYPKSTGNEKKYELIPGFAQQYFAGKIEKEKNNLLNYLLLADVYLRNENLLEAHNTLTDALKIAPDN
jgi:Tfp pilus assembly protein PilF